MVEAMEIPKGFKKTEIGIIPDDWDVYELGIVASYRRGSFPQPYGLPQWYDENNGMPFVQVFDVDDNMKLKPETKQKISDAAKDKSVFVPKGTIVLTIQGSIGRIAVTQYDAYVDRTLLIFQSFRKPIDKWFFMYVVYQLFQIEKAKAPGGTIKTITKAELSNFLIPLPPTKAEQTAIAEALNDADALITELEKLIAKKKAIKQGAMQELLKPKEGWEIKKLGTVANIRRGASPRPIKDPKWFSDRGRGWIRISDVTSSSVYLNSTTQYLSEDGARNSVAVDKGDLIMSICATIGVPIIINIPACIHDGFVLFKNYEKIIDTFFLYFFLQAQTEILIGKGQPGTQKNLNTTIVGNIEIAYPNIEKQQDIGLILRDIDIELSGLKKKLDKYKMLKQGMMQNLLTGRIRLV